MANPVKVLGFLDLAGAWDPSPALVMAGAIAVGAFAFAVARRRTVSFTGAEMRLAICSARRPTPGDRQRPVRRRLGVAGGEVKAVVFVVAMLVGMGVFELLERRGQTDPRTA